MKGEFVEMPTIMMSIPVKTKNIDRVEASILQNHKAGEGQCNRIKSGMLMSILKPPRIMATIWRRVFIKKLIPKIPIQHEFIGYFLPPTKL